MANALFKFGSPLLAIALAGGLYAHMRAYAQIDDTSPFHARVKQAIEEIPVKIGSWEGINADPPEAAGQLLRPNKLFSRRYRNYQTSQWATLIVIHCRDSRDMSGHYPPNCYRGSGWTQSGPPEIQTHPLWNLEVPIAMYEFSRTELEKPHTWVVYDFFVLPNGQFVTDMGAVQDASGDYRSRPYGCAQIQVLTDASATAEERQVILNQMLEPIEPVIRELRAAHPGGPS